MLKLSLKSNGPIAPPPTPPTEYEFSLEESKGEVRVVARKKSTTGYGVEGPYRVVGFRASEDKIQVVKYAGLSTTAFVTESTIGHTNFAKTIADSFFG